VEDEVLDNEINSATVFDQLFFLDSCQKLKVVEQMLLFVRSQHSVGVGLHGRIGPDGVSLGPGFTVSTAVAASVSHLNAFAFLVANLVMASIAGLDKITHY
jgi:hypothetical protein